MDIGTGMALQGVGSILGLGLNQAGNQQQMQQQQQLMQQQFQNQQALNLQNQTIQQQNWDYTNYGNQVKHMEDAGLNVGLMYGMGGGGGQSMGSGGGGSASGGQAPQNTNPQIMGLIQDAALKAAQVDLTKAQADKLRSETPTGDNTGDVNNALIKMKTANEAIQNKLQTETYDSMVSQVIANADKAQSEQRSALVKANIDENTQKAQEATINAEAVNKAFQLAVMKSGINVNEAQINKWVEDIKIGKFNAQTNAEFQGLDKVAGGQLTKIINWFNGATNTKPEYQREIK